MTDRQPGKTPAQRTSAASLVAAVCAAGLVIAATTYRLEGTGLYYDEVHQATGSFAYVGRPGPMFSLVPIYQLPLLNMPYTGAIKTAIYGIYLRVSGHSFSVEVGACWGSGSLRPD